VRDVSEPPNIGPWASRWQARTARLREIEAVLEAAPDSPLDLWFERARLLEELALREDAQRAYLDVLVRDRTHFGAMMSLGLLLATSGDVKSARIVFAEAVLRHPERAVAHVSLGNVLLDENDAEGARASFAAALERDPAQREAYRGLAISYERSGDYEAAERAWRQGFPDGSVAVAPYRGAGPPVRVLLVAAAIGGNIPIQHLLDDRVFEVATLVAESYADSTTLPPHDVVLNVIGDADRSARALDRAARALARTDAPVINRPEIVRVTGRAANAARFAGLEGVVTPRIATFARAELGAAGGAERLSAAGFRFPVLVRAPGYHTGEHFARVEEPGALRETVAALPGRDVLAIEYVETRRADGAWSKYRVMVVDGTPYPLHLAISTQWKVHYFTAAMADNAAYRDEERAFLTDVRGTLGDGVVAALERIGRAIGLDYFGIDFALDREGRVVVFESNATMVVTGANRDPRWSYRRVAIDRVAEAVRAMLKSRAAQHAGARNG